MRIRSIEYNNFRNFRDPGKIVCSTDGKITIVYGENGDGKTTLQQLIRWVFYGTIRFNKTTTDRLYNLAFEHNLDYGAVFEVMGRVEFEHDGRKYQLTRVATYKKELEDSSKLGPETITLLCQDDDYNWNPVDRPLDVIEELLPEGLSEYFFFDGESMIADLRVKGRDSASKLKKALYSMFDLEIIETAINHIGREELKTTVLGKLYMSQSPLSSDSQGEQLKSNILQAQNKRDGLEKEIGELEDEKQKTLVIVKQLSESIGSIPTKAQYEKNRKELKEFRDFCLKSQSHEYEAFGTEVMRIFPGKLVARAVENARQKMNMEVCARDLPKGINERLINYLSDTDTKKCICGRSLSNTEREVIKSWLKLLPPRSYASIYNDFVSHAKEIDNAYNLDELNRIMKDALSCEADARKYDAKIRKKDDEYKKYPDIEKLVVDRENAEKRVNEIDGELLGLNNKLDYAKKYLNQEMKKFNAYNSDKEVNNAIKRKMEIMQLVCESFRAKLDSETDKYSKELQDSIQELLDEMLSASRRVSVSKEFAVKVTDSYDDESKSEGQFAVVSFAYIGGIFKMLKNDPSLSAKEYPLVLDGPFSKLDPAKKENVIKVLPTFAPQVIVFSKDDLHNVIPEENIGRVWTICSNEEKNVAEVKEGKLWK